MLPIASSFWNNSQQLLECFDCRLVTSGIEEEFVVHIAPQHSPLFKNHLDLLIGIGIREKRNWREWIPSLDFTKIVCPNLGTHIHLTSIDEKSFRIKRNVHLLCLQREQLLDLHYELPGVPKAELSIDQVIVCEVLIIISVLLVGNQNSPNEWIIVMHFDPLDQVTGGFQPRLHRVFKLLQSQSEQAAIVPK